MQLLIVPETHKKLHFKWNDGNNFARMGFIDRRIRPRTIYYLTYERPLSVICSLLQQKQHQINLPYDEQNANTYFIFFSSVSDSLAYLPNTTLVQRIRIQSSQIAQVHLTLQFDTFITRFQRTSRFKSHKIVSDFRLKFWEHFPFSYPLLFNLFRWRCLRIPSLGSHSTKFIHVYVTWWEWCSHNWTQKKIGIKICI